MSTQGAKNRRRGHDAERTVVNYLRANGWPDARRYLSGDGRQPGDVDWHPTITLEVKDRASSAWPSWCRQAAEEAPEGTVPAVVRRTRGVADAGLWPCRVRLHFDSDGEILPRLMATSAGFVDGQVWVVCTLRDLAMEVARAQS